MFYGTPFGERYGGDAAVVCSMNLRRGAKYGPAATGMYAAQGMPCMRKLNVWVRTLYSGPAALLQTQLSGGSVECWAAADGCTPWCTRDVVRMGAVSGSAQLEHSFRAVRKCGSVLRLVYARATGSNCMNDSLVHVLRSPGLGALSPVRSRLGPLCWGRLGAKSRGQEREIF
ncbi:hypothetical protein Efla_002508 [Eimeria flavescens]